MSNEKIVRLRIAQPLLDALGGGSNAGGEPPDDGMNELAQRVALLEGKLNGALPSLATREDVEKVRTDVYKAIGDQTWKLISACVVLVGAVVWITHHAG